MDSISVITETPAGSNQKYTYDPYNGQVKLKKLLPAGMFFPFDFGFIPGTLGGDGDPLDVIMISEFTTFPGCAVECRIVGAFIVSQAETSKSKKTIRNDRFVAIPVESAVYRDVQTLKDFPRQLLSELEAFFINYIELEGKSIKIEKRISGNDALKLIEQNKSSNLKALVFEIFIPLQDQDGKDFPEKYYNALRKLLLEKFGGVTVYHRSPVTGIWDSSDSGVDKDKLVIFEVMAVTGDDEFWNKLKRDLEKQFQQSEILIRSARINTL